MWPDSSLWFTSETVVDIWDHPASYMWPERPLCKLGTYGSCFLPPFSRSLAYFDLWVFSTPPFHNPYLVVLKLNKYCLITTCQNQPSLSANVILKQSYRNNVLLMKTTLFLSCASSKLLWLIACLFLAVLGVGVESHRGIVLLSCSDITFVNITDRGQENSTLHNAIFSHIMNATTWKRLPSSKVLVSSDGVITLS